MIYDQPPTEQLVIHARLHDIFESQLTAKPDTIQTVCYRTRNARPSVTMLQIMIEDDADLQMALDSPNQ